MSPRVQCGADDVLAHRWLARCLLPLLAVRRTRIRLRVLEVDLREPVVQLGQQESLATLRPLPPGTRSKQMRGRVADQLAHERDGLAPMQRAVDDVVDRQSESFPDVVCRGVVVLPDEVEERYDSPSSAPCADWNHSATICIISGAGFEYSASSASSSGSHASRAAMDIRSSPPDSGSMSASRRIRPGILPTESCGDGSSYVSPSCSNSNVSRRLVTLEVVPFFCRSGG